MRHLPSRINAYSGPEYTEYLQKQGLNPRCGQTYYEGVFNTDPLTLVDVVRKMFYRRNTPTEHSPQAAVIVCSEGLLVVGGVSYCSKPAKQTIIPPEIRPWGDMTKPHDSHAIRFGQQYTDPDGVGLGTAEELLLPISAGLSTSLNNRIQPLGVGLPRPIPADGVPLSVENAALLGDSDQDFPIPRLPVRQ